MEIPIGEIFFHNRIIVRRHVQMKPRDKLMKEQEEFIRNAHSGQKYGNLPYTYHLELTASVAKRFAGFYPFLISPTVQLACFSHDVLEDTTVTEQDLVDQGFPVEVIDIIKRVTDEPGKNRKERKTATYPKIRGHELATAVKLCDRIANVEHCLNTGTGSNYLRMYQKEFAGMEQALRIGDQLSVLWEYLQKCLEAPNVLCR